MADSFATQLARSTGLMVAVRNTDQMALPGNAIRFLPIDDATLGTEGYRLDITDQFVTLEANGPAGFFYAVQTLYQLLPPVVLSRKRPLVAVLYPKPTQPRPFALSPDSLTLPACRIQDQPRYAYRGLMLDVSRHFFPVSVVKRYIDLMALHKFNTFHWHLTDDQGWRIEIKKYPKLTQVGANRRETLVGHYDEFDPQVFDGKPYGGFYTQADVRDVVRYAAAKQITVVPEIEMPGHALAALASYPELSCEADKPYSVATKWGVFPDVFCPTEKTFSFLEDVLTEVMDLFPGKYIHIGGDECPKEAWRKSAFCQQLMKREKLKNEDELQSWFITRIDKFVTKKGRRIIGWDEILEGGLSPNATVMSWRGTKGGIQAAQQRHDVIMTPGGFCYLDHLQGDPGQEPLGFGGILPLEMVYSYNPTDESLTPEQQRYILGVQGNLWTEYIPDQSQVEYMVWPRAAALAEVAWSPLTDKSYADFTRRLPQHFERLTQLGVNVSRTFYDPTFTAQPTPDGRVAVALAVSPSAASVAHPDVRYTLDGSIPSGESMRYEAPILLNKTTNVRAAAFAGPKPINQLAKIQKEFIVSAATGKSYTYLYPPTTGRPDTGQLLTDGNTGNMGGYEVADIVSYAGDFGVVLDLGRVQSVQGVRVGFLKYTARNMCLPKQVIIDVSDDGQTFQPVGTFACNAAEGGKRSFVRLPFDFLPTSARYVRVVARKAGQVPAGLRNPGQPAQMGVDEVEVMGL